MATIKLMGLKAGLPTTSGTADVVVNDGSAELACLIRIMN